MNLFSENVSYFFLKKYWNDWHYSNKIQHTTLGICIEGINGNSSFSKLWVVIQPGFCYTINSIKTFKKFFFYDHSHNSCKLSSDLLVTVCGLEQVRYEMICCNIKKLHFKSSKAELHPMHPIQSLKANSLWPHVKSMNYLCHS